MSKRLTTLLSILFSLGIVTGVSAYSNLSITSSGDSSIWQSSGGVITAITGTDTLGSTGDRIDWGYFDQLTATTATITGISSGHLIPSTNNTYDIGSPALSWNDVYVSGTIMAANGSDSAPTYAFDSDSGMFRSTNNYLGFTEDGTIHLYMGGGTGLFYGSWRPGADNTYDLGSTGNYWADFYLGDDVLPRTNNISDLGTPTLSLGSIYASGTANLTNLVITGTCTGCGSGGSGVGWSDFTTYISPTTSTRGVITYNAVTSTYFAATSTSQPSTFQDITFVDATGTSLSVSGLSSLGTLTVTSVTTTNLNLLNGNANIFVNGLVPRKPLILSGSGAISATTNGATSYQVELANGTNIYAQGFDATTTKYVSWGPILMSKCWDGGTLNDLTFDYMQNATDTGNVVWGLQGKILSSSTFVGGAWGDPVYATGTHGITYHELTVPGATNLTLGGSANATSSVMFRAFRSAVEDTLTVSTTLLSVRGTYGQVCYSD